MSVRPGDVLADRYRLLDLLVESGNGRFYRAHDKVLERHVALHVIAADDPRAPLLLDAARQSATVPDRRLLRVLDADQVDGLCYVVNEWGSGRSLDVVLATEGPLAPRRAAWLVSEVACSVAEGHAAGVAHGRLVPENVLVDHTGTVRVIGYCVDAALHGMPTDQPAADLPGLGALLYAALTGRWPGVPRSEVPAAPHEHGRVLRPRQVRAGIPRPLDAACDQLVNPFAAPTTRHCPDVSSARAVGELLRDFVGDPAGLAEAEARALRSNGRPGGRPDAGVALETVLMPQVAPTQPATGAETGTRPHLEADTGSDAEADTDPDAGVGPDETSEHSPEPGATAATGSGTTAGTGPATGVAACAEQPTEAGMPIFGDEQDDVSWMRARATPPPPPPAFEEPPERPLFAPEPPEGTPARRTRPGSRPSTAGDDYWPWDTGTGTGSGVLPVADDPEGDGADGADEVPGRSWLRLGAGLLAALVLLLAVVVAFNLGRGRTPLGTVPDDEPTSRPTATTGSTAPLAVSSATDLDPQGDPPEENPDLVPLAVDGNPSTAWRTMTYDQDFGPAGLKTGVGLTLDLGAPHVVSELELTLVGAPTSVSVYVSDEAPAGVGDLTPAARADVSRTQQRVSFDEPARGRYVTVWLTSLPQVDGGYRGEVAEVTVRG